MKKKTIKVLLASLSMAIAISACKNDDEIVKKPEAPENEGEVITTMTLILQDSANTSNVKKFTFRDPDGKGGNNYTQFDTIKLDANKTWFASVVLLNETASPADTISNEVLEEGADHLFCLTTDKIDVTITKTDKDKNGLGIGLLSTWKTNATGNGSIKITLNHQPGIKDGSCDKGDTDIEVNFPAVVY